MMAGLVSVPGLPQDQGTLWSTFSHLHNRPVYKLMKNLKAGWGMLSSDLLSTLLASGRGWPWVPWGSCSCFPSLQMEGAIALSALLFCPRCRMNNNDVLLSIKHCRKGSAVLDEEAVSLKRNEPRGETRCLHAALSQTRALAAWVPFLLCCEFGRYRVFVQPYKH